MRKWGKAFCVLVRRSNRIVLIPETPVERGATILRGTTGLVGVGILTIGLASAGKTDWIPTILTSLVTVFALLPSHPHRMPFLLVGSALALVAIPLDPLLGSAALAIAFGSTVEDVYRAVRIDSSG